MDEDDIRKSSLKDKIKHFFCLSCCFATTRREPLTSTTSTKRPLFLIPGASSQWIKSRAVVDLPEIKHKCRNLFARVGANHNHHHRRRRSSADFSYDPLSYALNFEEDGDDNDDAMVKNFVSRLPASPTADQSVSPVDHRNRSLLS